MGRQRVRGSSLCEPTVVQGFENEADASEFVLGQVKDVDSAKSTS